MRNRATSVRIGWVMAIGAGLCGCGVSERVDEWSPLQSTVVQRSSYGLGGAVWRLVWQSSPRLGDQGPGFAHALILIPDAKSLDGRLECPDATVVRTIVMGMPESVGSDKPGVLVKATLRRASGKWPYRLPLTYRTGSDTFRVDAHKSFADPDSARGYFGQSGPVRLLPPKPGTTRPKLRFVPTADASHPAKAHVAVVDIQGTRRYVALAEGTLP